MAPINSHLITILHIVIGIGLGLTNLNHAMYKLFVYELHIRMIFLTINCQGCREEMKTFVQLSAGP